MKPLNLEETKLKEEMKHRCLNKGQYIDKNAKAKFDMICHLEDFEVQYWELERENQKLNKQLEELEFIVGLRQKRNLISKFDKEYDEEDKKKNPNRDYAGIMPDAEEIYKRYYSMKKQQKEFINYLKNEIDRCLTFYSSTPCMYAYDVFKDVLSKYKSIIGGKNK